MSGDGVFDRKMRRNPYAAWGWDYDDSGPTEITGDLDMKGNKIYNLKDPTNPQDAVTKKYVDDAVGAGGGGGGGGGPTTASNVSLTPTTHIQATDVQKGFEALDTSVAFVSSENTFTHKQNIAGAEFEEVSSAVPYNGDIYASPTGKVTQISSANNINFVTPELNLNGDLIPASTIKYTAKAGGQVQGVTVQQAIEATDTLLSGVKGDFVPKTGLTANLSAQNFKITNLADGQDAGDAVNKNQLDGKVAVTDFNTLQGTVTQNTADITALKDGTTKLNSENVIFAPDGQGVLAGKTNVQEALFLTDSLIKANQTAITALQASDQTFLTKSNGVLETDLDASGNTVTGLGVPQRTNDATTKDYVDKAIQAIQSSLSGQLQWAGTYDCADNQIKTLSDVGASATDGTNKLFTVGSILPQPSAHVKNYYFIVVNKTPATGNPPAPQQPLSAGDWIIGDTQGWSAIEMAKAITASNVGFTQTGSVTAQNVQGAIAQVDTALTTVTGKLNDLIAGTNKLQADKVSYTPKTGGVITGATVQEALTSADGTLATAQANITANTTKITQVETTLNDTAKVSAENTFTRLNVFQTVPQTTATPTQDNELATVKSIKDTVRALTATMVTYSPGNTGLNAQNAQSAIDLLANADNINFTSQHQASQNKVGAMLNDLDARVKSLVARSVKSADVSMTAELPNIPGGNVQAVLTSVNTTLGNISDYTHANSTLVGLYDGSNNTVISVFGLGSSGNIVAGQGLPAPDDANKAFFLIVKKAGTGANPLPTSALKSGDIIRSTGSAWEIVDASSIKTASDIPVTAIQGFSGNNVQEVLESIKTAQGSITASQVRVDPAIQGLTGDNVQAILTSAGVEHTNLRQRMDQVSNAVQTITAGRVSYDNATTNFPGNDVNTVQKAFEAVKTKIDSLPTTLEASHVTFTSGAGIAGTNVAEALDELKRGDSAFITKTGGELGGDLNARNNTISNLKAPAQNDDAARKVDVQNALNDVGNTYLPKVGGVLGGDLNASDHRIVNLEAPDQDRHAANKYYVDNAITVAGADYVTRTGGTLAGDLSAGGNKITNLGAPGADTDATNRQYVTGEITTRLATLESSLENTYVKKAGGSFVGPTNFDAGGVRITNIGAPSHNNDAVRKLYVDGTFLPKVGARLGGDLDANNKYIANLIDANSPGDAVNKRVLDRAIEGIRSQLTGKLTFCGTYNASTHTVASVSTAGGTHGFTVGQQLPADATGIANCFVIVMAEGTGGTGGTPAGRLGVGDILLAQGGSGWLNIPIGSTRAAVNVSVDAIQQLAGATNVQQALEQLATRQGGGGSADQVTFTPTANIQATNVQGAIQELEQETVRTTGDQEINGRKSFWGGVVAGSGTNGLRIQAATSSYAQIEWYSDANSGRYCQLGFNDLASPKFSFRNQKGGGTFQFNNTTGYEDANTSISEAWQFPTKKYVDEAITAGTAGFLSRSGGTMTGDIDMATHKLINLGVASGGSDALSLWSAEQRFVALNTDQNVGGIKVFETKLRMGRGRPYAQFTPDDNSAKPLRFTDSSVGANNKFDLDLENRCRVMNLPDPAENRDATPKIYVESNFVKLTGNQTVGGRKKFTDGIDATGRSGFAFNRDIGAPAYFEWFNAQGQDRYCYVGFASTSTPNKFSFVIERGASNAAHPMFEFNRVVGYSEDSIEPTDPKHLVTKKYVDDAVGGGGGGSGGISLVSASNVNVTANFAGLQAVGGEALYSHRIMKDSATGDVLSALFGLKITLRNPWTPTVSNNPTELVAGAHIPGQEYYRGLPIPPDPSLGNRNFKTVAQIHLYRALPSNGINLIQTDNPIKIGRIVCVNDSTGSGWTKLFVVFSYNQALAVPTGTGAFYVMRYEGLPTMVL